MPGTVSNHGLHVQASERKVAWHVPCEEGEADRLDDRTAKYRDRLEQVEAESTDLVRAWAGTDAGVGVQEEGPITGKGLADDQVDRLALLQLRVS